jgi:hypothetical protein
MSHLYNSLVHPSFCEVHNALKLFKTYKIWFIAPALHLLLGFASYTILDCHFMALSFS